jgi:hypothetical protein
VSINGIHSGPKASKPPDMSDPNVPVGGEGGGRFENARCARRDQCGQVGLNPEQRKAAARIATSCGSPTEHIVKHTPSCIPLKTERTYLTEEITHP